MKSTKKTMTKTQKQKENIKQKINYKIKVTDRWQQLSEALF